MIPKREDAIELLQTMVTKEGLLQHMYAVEASMRAYALIFKQDQDKWGITGLLHDADWEKYPKQHPKGIVDKLNKMGVDKDLIHAIASHGNNSEENGLDYFETRTTLLDKALFACDELSGFVVAVAKVRPTGLNGMQPKSIKKKLKDKRFAAQVNRSDIEQGSLELEVDKTEHIQTIIDALTTIQSALNC